MIQNSPTRYGIVSKSFHWLTALLILTAFPLGIIATNLPVGSAEQVTTAFWVFSLHKTVGVTAFFVGLTRILWTIPQPKPASLQHAGWEPLIAAIVHWLLYISMVIVPLSGWLHHAALDGFAPIWWPFGQSLPFVPKSEPIAHFFGAWHFVFTKVLALSVLLHIAGALKHHFIDKDGTLLRMLPGTPHLPDLRADSGGHRGFWIAGMIYLIALGGGSALGLQSKGHNQSPSLAEVASDWDVESGTLAIQFNQFGSQVSGQFSDWTTAISFDEETQTGEVTVTINVGSLDIGTLTPNAMQAEFLDVSQFPTAIYQARIKPTQQGLVAEGSLNLKGVSVPLNLPFELTIEEGLAKAQGQTKIDRRDHKIGEGQTSKDDLGFNITIKMELTARKGE